MRGRLEISVQNTQIHEYNIHKYKQIKHKYSTFGATVQLCRSGKLRGRQERGKKVSGVRTWARHALQNIFSKHANTEIQKHKLSWCPFIRKKRDLDLLRTAWISGKKFHCGFVRCLDDDVMVGRYKLLTLAKKGSIPGLPCLDLAILSNTLKISGKILKEEKTSILGIKPVRLRSYCLIHLRYRRKHLTGGIKSRAKQDHRRWRYHVLRLSDYQSPFF